MFKFLLYPASWLYKMAVLFRHQLFDWGILHSEKFDIPVICIGNITVGGTGKTSAGRNDRRLHVADASRGIAVARLRPSHEGLPRGCGDGSLPRRGRRTVADQTQNFPILCVVVCERRADGIRRIRTEHPEVDLIVMDDGFQHRYVEAKINVVLIDATRPVQETGCFRSARCATCPGSCTAPTISS